MFITKNTTIGEILEKYPEKVSILQEYFHAVCFGCPMSQIETLEQACDVHEVELKEVLKELNKN